MSSIEFYTEVPVERVFAFLSQAENMLSLIPRGAFLSYSDVHAKPDGGYGYKVAFKFLRLTVSTSSETTEIIPNRKLVIQTQGQMRGHTIWLLEPAGKGTQVTVCYEYDEPDTPFAAVSRQFLQVILRNTLAEIAANAARTIR